MSARVKIVKPSVIPPREARTIKFIFLEVKCETRQTRSANKYTDVLGARIRRNAVDLQRGMTECTADFFYFFPLSENQVQRSRQTNRLTSIIACASAVRIYNSVLGYRLVYQLRLRRW